MVNQATIDKPLFGIFLDIDGVFNYDSISCKKLDQLIQEKFNGDPGHTRRCESCLTCKKAEALLFKPSAVENFENLIKKMQEHVNVHVIISSTWRVGYSLSELKEIFSPYFFSQLIVDKTSEKDLYNDYKTHCKMPHFDIDNADDVKQAKENLASSKLTKNELLELSFQCRASQINKWIFHHQEYFSYLVIDDFDEHLSDNFSDKFISTFRDKPLFHKDDADKAYEVFLKLYENHHSSLAQMSTNNLSS